MLHEEQAAATTTLQKFGTGRVWDGVWVEALAFVGDAYGEGVFLPEQGNTDFLFSIGVIAVQDGICDGLRKAYQDVTLHIGVKVIAGGHILDKWFDFGYILGVRR